MYDEVNLPRDPYQAGLIIGQRSRQIMHEYVLVSEPWQSLTAWIDSERIKNMENAARAAFVDYIEELAGIADGCEMPFSHVFLWNCRGDLAPFISDGCTTVGVPSTEGILLGHNEDGDPHLRPHCFIAKREAGIKPGYTSFTYPASINGHTFSVNSTGIVQLVDNIRSLEYGDGIPRQILARAILDCHNLDDAVAIFENCPRAGSFHHLLAQSGVNEALSIEYTPREISAVSLDAGYGHTNHFIHPQLRNSKQRITASSAHRQNRIDRLCRKLSAAPVLKDIHRMLSDSDNPALPIFRTDPTDPDNENTFATALFRVSSDAIESKIYAAGFHQEQPFACSEIFMKS